VAEPDLVLSFWFPAGLDRDTETHTKQLEWWFRGGADAEIVERFGTLTVRALAGELDDWANGARGRLALILTLDQFPRSLFRNTPRTYAGDPRALALALEGLENGQYEALEHVWEKMFFMMPLGHSEKIEHLEHAVRISESLVELAPPHLRKLYAHSVSQARGHLDVVRRFGRQPHRNPILGRESTPEELEYIKAGNFVHQRPIPK